MRHWRWPHSLLNLAETYEGKGDIQQAIAKFNEAKALAVELDAQYEMEAAYIGLAQSYAKTADHEQALPI